MNTDSLKTIQNDFIHALKQKKVYNNAFVFLAGDTTTSAKGFQIYKNHYRVKRVKTLKHIYPVCEKLVGPLFFRKMIDDYLEQYPSLSYNLNDYGHNLADYLKNDNHLLALLPYIIDILKLEWHIHSLLTCKDESLFDWRVLNTLFPEQSLALIFYRAKNGRLLESFFPIDTIFEMNQPGFDKDDTMTLSETQKPLFFWVQRVQWDIKIHRLDSTEYDLLKRLDGKKTLTALEKEMSSAVLTEQLPLLIQKGYVAGFD